MSGQVAHFLPKIRSSVQQGAQLGQDREVALLRAEESGEVLYPLDLGE